MINGSGSRWTQEGTGRVPLQCLLDTIVISIFIKELEKEVNIQVMEQLKNKLRVSVYNSGECNKTQGGRN